MIDNNEAQLSAKNQPAEAILKAQCENMWTEINQVHERVNSTPPMGELGATQTPMLSVYQAKAKHLQAEVHTLDSKQPQALPRDPTILKAMLHKELTTSNKELEQTLQVVQSQRKELEEELAREKSILEKHIEVARSLESKLQAASEETRDSDTTSRSAQDKELQRQRKSGVQQQQKLMTHLAAFVTKHFPKPTAQQMLEGRKSKTKRKDGDEDPTEYMSLLEILEILMNKCTDSETDPYVTVDDISWPPYIELLLRCGLALRHPQDYKRIRLVPFHL